MFLIRLISPTKLSHFQAGPVLDMDCFRIPLFALDHHHVYRELPC